MKEVQPYYRSKPIQVVNLEGEFIVTQQVIDETRLVLTDYSNEGATGHEGLVFWCGREIENLTIFSTVLAPKTNHGPQHVMVEEIDYGRGSKASRENRVNILCQVHSHPSEHSIHSDGDDSLIILPFRGMLSIVVKDYGKNFCDMTGVTVHQYLNNVWSVCNDESVRERFHIVPSLIDLRG